MRKYYRGLILISFYCLLLPNYLIYADIVRSAKASVQINANQNFVLIGPQIDQQQVFSSNPYEYAVNNSKYYFPYGGGWIYRDIDLSSLPPKIITSIDAGCYIETSSYGYVDAVLTDNPETASWYLCAAAHGYVTASEYGIAAFNGLTLNRVWRFWAFEDYSVGSSFLNNCWIKIYYTEPSLYCSASGSCDEYIYEVVTGEIDNISGCDNYFDYTQTHSSTMIIGQSYPIEIIGAVGEDIGYGYEGDCLGIWIDWNQDNDFDDTGEMVYAVDDYGYFTTNITVPTNAVIGNTRMRIRLAYETILSPCGATPNGGEVEDYTINVAAADNGIAGDFAPPDGVDFIDYSILAKQWQLEKLSFDTIPTGGDGIVNFLDFTAFAQSWQGDMTALYSFASQWLQKGMYNADIAPSSSGDGIVDLKDLEIFAANWLTID